MADSKLCPDCKNVVLEPDSGTGPGKWYWCPECRDWTIYPHYAEWKSDPDPKNHGRNQPELKGD